MWNDDSFIAEFAAQFEKGKIWIKNDPTRVDDLMLMFPFSLGRLAWWDLPPDSYITGQYETLDSDEILDFLKFASLVAGIPDNTIIVMLGDNMDNDYMMEFSLLSRLYSSLLDYPQHVCVFPEDLRWCFEFSFEQDLHFGYAPPEGWKRQRSRIRGTRA